jgi:hypothetical protein
MSFRVKTTYKSTKNSQEKNSIKNKDVDSSISSISSLLYGDTETKEPKKISTQGLSIKLNTNSEDYY